MLESFTGRPIRDPVLLILVKLLHSFDHEHQQTQYCRDPFELRLRDRKSRHQRDQTGDDYLATFKILYRRWAVWLFLSYQEI